jgi:hypothetical protein
MDSYPGLPSCRQCLDACISTANDKGAIDVRLSTAVNDGIELIVADDCCGMTLQVKRQAFDRSSLLIATRGATGLGSHIVNNIIAEQLGGQIRLDSELDAGTRVQLILPRTAPGRENASSRRIRSRLIEPGEGSMAFRGALNFITAAARAPAPRLLPSRRR